MPSAAPVSIVETPEFLSVTRKLLDEEERTALVDYLAHNPNAGELIPATGGVRKLRWALAGRGKRGGARVIYFYHNANLPLFLLPHSRRTCRRTSVRRCATIFVGLQGFSSRTMEGETHE